MRRNAGEREDGSGVGGRRLIFAAGLLFLLGVLATLIISLMRSNAGVDGGRTPAPISAIHRTGRPLPSDPRIVDLDLRFVRTFPRIARAVERVASETVLTKPSFEKEYWTRCWKEKDFFRIHADPLCTTMWMRQLKYGQVEKVSNLLAVIPKAQEKGNKDKEKPQQSGGMKVAFKGHELTVGYWKPCLDDATGNGESWWPEVIAFMIDRLGGFYHTPAVVPRSFSPEELRRWGRDLQERGEDEYGLHKMETAIELCSTKDGMVAGAMVGWENFDIELLKHHHYWPRFVRFGELENSTQVEQLRTTLFDITTASPRKQIDKVLEIVSIHLFCMLTGTFSRLDHNLFYAKTHPVDSFEPFVYIDNDRSGWRRTTLARTHELHEDGPASVFCKFPAGIIRRLRVMQRQGEGGGGGHTLGRLIQDATRLYAPAETESTRGRFFTSKEAKVLDQDVEFVLRLVDRCVERHGEERVLFEEAWAAPEYLDVMANVADVFNMVGAYRSS